MCCFCQKDKRAEPGNLTKEQCFYRKSEIIGQKSAFTFFSQSYIDHASQVVICRLLSAKACVRSWAARPCEIHGGQSGTGAGFFSECYVLPLPLSFHYCSLRIFRLLVLLVSKKTWQSMETFRQRSATPSDIEKQWKAKHCNIVSASRGLMYPYVQRIFVWLVYFLYCFWNFHTLRRLLRLRFI